VSAYRGRREFRLGPGFILFYVLLTLFVAAGAVMTYRERGWNWVSLGLAGATVLGLGAIIESLILRIQLTDDALVVTDLRGRRRYPMKEIARVEEAKGVSPMLVLADGRAVRLPSVAGNLGNSVRAWLKGYVPA
jgi:hypothetical protein